MRSHALEEACAPPARERATELLVLWQHPQTRRILPVGRLAHDGTTYTFDYTRAAGDIDGFRQLPGMGRPGEQFQSTRLPSLLRQRVMSPDRPDFFEYVGNLGLSPATATPWEQIVESGGERAGDTLQFMELPRVNDANLAQARFLVNGVRYVAGVERQISGIPTLVDARTLEDAFSRLHVGDRLEILPEEGNEIDEHALMVVSSGVPLGWVPRFLAPSVRRLLSEGRVFATVMRVNGPSAPTHLRLALEMNAPAPVGFSFDPEGSWEPLST